jgi:hypothetical protein
VTDDTDADTDTATDEEERDQQQYGGEDDGDVEPVDDTERGDDADGSEE